MPISWSVTCILLHLGVALESDKVEKTVVNQPFSKADGHVPFGIYHPCAKLFEHFAVDDAVGFRNHIGYVRALDTVIVVKMLMSICSPMQMTTVSQFCMPTSSSES